MAETVQPSASESGAKRIEKYIELFDKNDDVAVSARKQNYAALAQAYYAMGGELYELGWGRSFHFCPLEKGETLAEGIQRRERYISDRLKLKPGMTAFDAGCGVGGPMREIARHSGARIVGATIVPEQVAKARRYNEEAGLSNQCDVILADFVDLPFDDASFDRVYAIGSTCHAPERTRVFKELFRVLKPGGLFVADETVLTDRFDAADPGHQRIRREFERGYGIADMITAEECCRSMVEAGFELLETNDDGLEGDPEMPRYSPLDTTGLSVRALARSPVGRKVINQVLGVLETLLPSSKGSRDISDVLNVGADATVEGGKAGIVTTLFFMLARKKDWQKSSSANNETGKPAP